MHKSLKKLSPWIFFAMALFGCATEEDHPPPPAAFALTPISNTPPPLPAGVYEIDKVGTVPVETHTVTPTYPGDMQDRGFRGKALILFIARADGSVDTPTIIKATDIEFGKSAAEAVCQWKFKPATVNGRPVDCRMAIPIEFTVDNDQSAEDEGSSGRSLSDLTPIANPAPATPGGTYDLHEVGTLPIETHTVTPHYPKEMRAADIRGSALIWFIARTDGTVTNATIIKATNIEFGESALRAVRQWRFRPATLNGKAVDCCLEVPLEFTMN